MEVKPDKPYPVAASVEQAWVVLSDMRATAACMPGAQISGQIDDTHDKGAVKSKVGPAVMDFGGEIEVLAPDPAARSVRRSAKGADKAASTASLDLTVQLASGEEPGRSVPVGVAAIRVGGKLAQFGRRLLEPVSDAMLVRLPATSAPRRRRWPRPVWPPNLPHPLSPSLAVSPTGSMHWR